jgi:hypothetical protein
MCNEVGVRANQEEGSLLRSYSLRKAASNHIGQAQDAVSMFVARRRFVRAQADLGNLDTITIEL